MSAEQVPFVPRQSPGNTAQPLSALAPSRLKAGNFRKPPKNGTTSGCPPPSRRRSYRSALPAQYRDSARDAPRPTFWKDVAQIARNHRSKAKTRCHDEGKQPGIPRSEICCLRLAPVSGISATTELWPGPRQLCGLPCSGSCWRAHARHPGGFTWAKLRRWLTS